MKRVAIFTESRYFSIMINRREYLNGEQEASIRLQELLSEIPFIQIVHIDSSLSLPNGRVDLLVDLQTDGGDSRLLVCEFKSSGQPRYARSAIHQLQSYVLQFHQRPVTPVFIAPFISEQSRTLCRESGMSYLDLVGNCRIVWDGVFIERTLPPPPAMKRELKSLFTPKSAQVLRLMLNDPARHWRVADLAEQAGVSLGHVSNIKKRLLDQEWAFVSDDGLGLTNPTALLEGWRAHYSPPEGRRLTFYTPLHGKEFDNALQTSFALAGDPPEALLASFSAARWQSPYGRSPNEYFYATEEGAQRLKAALSLSPIEKGYNVVITRSDDPSVYSFPARPAPGISCTSALLTYLDLSQAGERGREAADYLRQELLQWP
jgi:hypothetical protein